MRERERGAQTQKKVGLRRAGVPEGGGAEGGGRGEPTFRLVFSLSRRKFRSSFSGGLFRGIVPRFKVMARPRCAFWGSLVSICASPVACRPG